MRVRLLCLSAAIALSLGLSPAGALPGADALTGAAPVVAGGGASLVGTIPNATAISAAFDSDAPIMYLHTLNGLAIYDISTPELPVPVGGLPLPNFQNEAMTLAERYDGDGDVEVKFLLVGFDLYGTTLDDPTDVNVGGYEMLIIDVTDISNPHIRGRIATESSAHTMNCADAECYTAYTSGAYEPFFNPIDLTDLDNPVQGERIYSVAGEGHDWDDDDAGIQWHVGTKGIVAYDVSDALNPVPLASSDEHGLDYHPSEHNNFILHNSIRPHADAFSQEAGADGRLDSGDPDLFAGNVLLVTEEDYIDARCGREGAFSTWHIPSLDAAQFAADNPAGAALTAENRAEAYGQGAITPLGTWNTEIMDSGVKTPAGAFCSAHYFDYHEAGIVAQGWYQQGTRFLDVRDPSNIKQVGYFFTAAMETWGAYWVPEYDEGGLTGAKTDLVYTNDVVRGIDILRFDFDGLAEPDATRNLTAPILPEWLAPSAEVIAALEAREDARFGYLCRLAPSL